MLIQTNSNYPIVNERNKRIHVPQTVAEVAIYHGHATAVSPAKRGTNAYLEERAAEIKAVATPTVSWIIRASTDGDTQKRPAIYATCSNALCSVRFRYEGKPEHAADVMFTHSCGSHQATKVPAEIAAQYRIACEKFPLIEYPADEAKVLAYAASQNEDSGRREVNHGKPMLNRDGSLYKLFFEK
jgi:hypothetical protein